MEECYFSFRYLGMYFQLTKMNKFQILKNLDGWKTIYKFTFWYISFLNGLAVDNCRKFGYYKCFEFIIISLYFFNVIIFIDKQTFINFHTVD